MTDHFYNLKKRKSINLLDKKNKVRLLLLFERQNINIWLWIIDSTKYTDLYLQSLISANGPDLAWHWSSKQISRQDKIYHMLLATSLSRSCFCQICTFLRFASYLWAINLNLTRMLFVFYITIVRQPLRNRNIEMNFWKYCHVLIW